MTDGTKLLRMPPELAERIITIAETEDRTVTGQIVYFLRRAVADYERTHGPLPERDASAPAHNGTPA